MLTNDRENVSRKMASSFKKTSWLLCIAQLPKIGTIYLQGVPSFWNQSFNTIVFHCRRNGSYMFQITADTHPGVLGVSKDQTFFEEFENTDCQARSNIQLKLRKIKKKTLKRALTFIKKKKKKNSKKIQFWNWKIHFVVTTMLAAVCQQLNFRHILKL